LFISTEYACDKYCQKLFLKDTLLFKRFGLVTFFMKEMNTYIQQERIKLIKSDIRETFIMLQKISI